MNKTILTATFLSFLLPGWLHSQETKPVSAETSPPSPVEDLYTNVYTVPPSFLSTDRSSSNDRKTARQILEEEAGIEFGPGASVMWGGPTSQLVIRNTAEQMEILEAYLDTIRLHGKFRQLHILFEAIEVEMEDFSGWLQENHLENDATDLRRTVQEWIDNSDAVVLESSTLTARSGQRAKVESVEKFVYPTEYDPPEIPNKLALSDGAESPATAVVPTAFETRNLGHTFEVDSVLDSTGTAIFVNLAPEMVTLTGYSYWPREETDVLFRESMPTFYSMKIHTQLTVWSGRYGYVGSTRPHETKNKRTRKPLVLQFIRVDVGSVGGIGKDEEVEK